MINVEQAQPPWAVIEDEEPWALAEDIEEAETLKRISALRRRIDQVERELEGDIAAGRGIWRFLPAAPGSSTRRTSAEPRRRSEPQADPAATPSL